ncbi:MAG: helix-turn-helix domain-containing protein [Elusimicrobiales bacterium]
MHANLQTIVGKKIRQFRLADGLTLEELAFRSQLHPNYLGDLERGRRNPSLANLKKIADGLKKPLEDLISGTNSGKTIAKTQEKTPVFFSVDQEKDLISLIKVLRTNSKKDRQHIIKIAKAMSVRLKTQ